MRFSNGYLSGSPEAVHSVLVLLQQVTPPSATRNRPLVGLSFQRMKVLTPFPPRDAGSR